MATRRSWRIAAWGGMLSLTVLAGPAHPQTLFVTRVPPGTLVELVVNRTSLLTATADPTRLVRFELALPDRIGKSELAARILVDTCPKGVRIVLAERGVAELPAGDCTRRDLTGVYLVREMTTLLVSLADPVPFVRIRQGPVPAAWLASEAQGGTPLPRAVAVPTGLVLAGSGNLAAFRNFGPLQCGDVSDCASKGTRPAYAAAASLWPWPFLAASAAYIRPGRLTAAGRGADYRFDADLDVHLVAVTARAGGPVGRARLFGEAGLVYHRARGRVSQTIDPATVAEGDETVIIEGGTQRFQTETAGWGWLVGGGLEIWMSPRLGLVVAFDRAAVKGKALDNSEARLDEWVTLVTLGLQLRLGG
jgi:hypothetical protein